MNNIEERIESLKANVELSKMVTLDELTVSVSDLDALIAQLEAKNIRADACVNAFEGIETERFAGKSIGEFLAGEVRLNKAEPKPDGSFGFTFSGLAIQIMAESFADQFKSSGAVNYLELLFDHSEVGPLTVTMQRVDGLTPAQKLATAEAALSAANEKLKGEQVPVAYFAAAPDYGWDMFNNKEDAIATCQAEIDAYRECRDDGWDDDVQRVCWGIVIQKAEGFDHQGVHTSNSHHTYQTCDYSLRPVVVEGNADDNS